MTFDKALMMALPHREGRACPPPRPVGGAHATWSTPGHPPGCRRHRRYAAGMLKKLLVLALLATLGVVAAKRLRAS